MVAVTLPHAPHAIRKKVARAVLYAATAAVLAELVAGCFWPRVTGALDAMRPADSGAMPAQIPLVIRLVPVMVPVAVRVFVPVPVGVLVPVLVPAPPAQHVKTERVRPLMTA